MNRNNDLVYYLCFVIEALQRRKEKRKNPWGGEARRMVEMGVKSKMIENFVGLKRIPKWMEDGLKRMAEQMVAEMI